ncbi:Protein-disulfide isomerase [Leucobacter chromiiresistens]|uniref:Protein-disulfide isomerase n=1 Tax=Leucobacter chromiiresistens TaxID=1079994 RepID=A0A1H0YBB9_9MICO|nr:Protein-disulfide isomerase [Leucobacter chromiiresistens]
MYPRRVSQRSTSSRTSQRRLKSWLFLAAAVIVFLGVVIFAQASMNSGNGSFGAAAKQGAAAADGSGADTGAGDSAAPTGFETRDPADPMAIGDADAPVVLVEWTDMRCPYCAVFNQETLPTIVDEYVEAGKVRIEVRDVAFFGEASETASVAARAAGEQGRFMEYLDAVYAAAPAEGHPDLPADQLIGFAEEVGVPDIAKFTADLEDPALRAAVQQSTATAQQAGVTGVPFFAIGTDALSGAQPIDAFRGFLDAAIEAAPDSAA